MSLRVTSPSSVTWWEPAVPSANRGDVDLVVYAVGTPPEESGSDRLPTAIQPPL
jgi:hypothetical protein